MKRKKYYWNIPVKDVAVFYENDVLLMLQFSTLKNFEIVNFASVIISTKWHCSIQRFKKSLQTLTVFVNHTKLNNCNYNNIELLKLRFFAYIL